MGVIKSIVGLMQYYACSTLASMAGEGQSTCASSGPGQNVNIIFVSLAYASQFLMVLLAFLLLPCSHSKTRNMLTRQVTSQVKEDSALDKVKKERVGNTNCCGVTMEKGGRLQSFLI